MSYRFTEARPPSLRLTLAVCLFAAAVPLPCFSFAAAAADMTMPMKAPATPPAYQWSGCYLGANAGGGTSGTNFSGTVDPGSYLLVGNGDPATVTGSAGGGANADGFVGGGQIGCNLQTGTLVLGLEGDFEYFHSNPNFNNNTNTLSAAVGSAPFAITQSLTTSYLATVRPRVGIAADRNFAYVTGGAAFTSVSYSESYTDANGGVGAASASKALVGWTAGAGWEYALADHWTVRAEYLFASFPNVSAAGTISGPVSGTNALHGSTDLVVQLIRAGVNFKF